MATKASASTKKPAAVAKKAAPVKKPAARRTSAAKVNQGDLFYCETCGLEVIVNECGEVAVTPNFICCEEVMKLKPAKAKAAVKKAK